MKPILLEEISSPGCHNCKAFEEFWYSIEKSWSNVTFKNVSIMTHEGQELAQKHMVLASPGIILNGELWATGGFDKEKFLMRIKELSQ